MSNSPNLGLPLVAQSQSQKEVTINQGVDGLDVAVAGLLVKSVAGGADVTLTTSPPESCEALNAIIRLTGALTGNINVIFPNVTRRWHVINATTGAHTVTLKGTSGSGVAIAQGSENDFRFDGTNFVALTFTGAGAAVTMGGDVTGLSSATSVGQLHRNFVSKATADSPYAVASTDSVIGVDSSGGDVEIDLPAATGGLREIVVKKLGSSAHVVTVKPNGTDTIDGANATVALVDYVAMTFKDYGSGTWAVIG